MADDQFVRFNLLLVVDSMEMADENLWDSMEMADGILYVWVSCWFNLLF